MSKSQIPPAGTLGKTIAGFVSLAFNEEFSRVFILFTDGTAMETYAYGGIYFAKYLDSGGLRGIEGQMRGGTILGEGFIEGVDVPWRDWGDMMAD